MKNFAYLLIFLLTACGSAAPASPAARTINPSSISPEAPMSSNQYAPQPGDAALTRGKIFLESTDMLVMESYPVQIAINIKGSLPTSCNNLRAVINAPDSNKNIKVDLYSVIDPNLMCAQTLQPFEATLSLGSFPTGHYTVLINDEKLGTFDS